MDQVAYTVGELVWQRIVVCSTAVKRIALAVVAVVDAAIVAFDVAVGVSIAVDDVTPSTTVDRRLFSTKSRK